MNTCPTCKRVIPNPKGRPRLYDVSALAVGEKARFPYRDHHQRTSIRCAVKQFGYRHDMEFEVYTGNGDELVVERTY